MSMNSSQMAAGDAVTVVVWENNFLPYGRARGHDWWGHAALQIGAWSYYEDQNASKTVDTYVSWWPGDSTSSGPALGRTHGLIQDISLEGYLPDHLIRVPADVNQRKRMLSAWEEQRNHGGKHWRKYRKNCSGMVAKILRAGGLAGGALDSHSYFWTPNKVRKLALAAGGREMQWTAVVGELSRSGYSPLDWREKQGRDARFSSCGAPCKHGNPPP